MTLLEHEIPTVVNVLALVPGIHDIPCSAIYDNTLSGTESIIIETIVADTQNTLYDLVVDFLFTSTTRQELVDVCHEVQIEDIENKIIDTSIELWQLGIQPTMEEIATELFLYTGLHCSSIDSKVSFRINIGSIPTDNNIFNEVYLHEPKYFDFESDIFCATSGILFNIGSDIKQQKGYIEGIYSSIYNTNIDTASISYDIYCSNSISHSFIADLATNSGTIEIINDDIYTVGLNTPIGPKVDIKTRSLFIDYFFLDTGSFTTASAIGYIDIIDYIYPVIESSTYIQKNDVTMSGVYFEDIPNGKRMYFNPEDDFYCPGEIILSVHAESSIGEILNEDFFLLYGYDIELNESVHWKPTQRIVVRAEATNLEFCPNEEGVAYYFDTRDYHSYNLPASIGVVEAVDLPVSIYPQSTAFFYGKIYTVRVSGVKDFAGNVMESFTYTFTIESADI